MTTTRTSDVAATTEQINRLAEIGCDIIRVAVPDMESADAITKIKENITIPLVADIHFNHKLALRAIEAGADKIRINPGNIGGDSNVKKVADACNQKNIPIRIGVNSGSLEKELLAKYNGVTAEAMVESVMGHVKLLNRYDFDNIWLSAKTSSVSLTVKIYRLLHEQTNYPLHLGITEAGTEYSGIIKSSMGIGTLLLDGIGDTIRVSLTADPVREIKAAKTILTALNLRPGIEIISCPTCGRCNIDIQKIADEVDELLSRQAEELLNWHGDKNLTVAIMGCAVNGPGEAKQADFGIAGIGAGMNTGTGTGAGTANSNTTEGLLFAKGETIKKAPIEILKNELIELISKENQ